jgi:tetratricopeptide (TPR) repeat protein
MASIIPGYEYDIFISYRQKDNKYDGWVTEFVENLKKELEATFKEEISVYFDINPHDGLLETHDVSASLKEKLNCLIFIPILSQTYCDPNCFAWQHEFCAFNKIARGGSLGLNVKLRGGNIASRILPVKINDLEPEDNELLEIELGGFLRAIEFIYKEPGVNRPLTPGDDPKTNLNRASYRNQINKVAHAIKEIILGMKAGTQPGIKEDAVHKIQPERVMERFNHVRKAKSGMISWQKILSGIFIVVALILAGFYIYPLLFQADRLEMLRKKGQVSVAVLPFQNLTRDAERDFWEVMIQDNLITSLSNESDLKVRQTQTVNSLLESHNLANYASLTPTLARSVSQKLDANVFVQGSFTQIGAISRLNAKLVDSKTEEVFKSFQLDGNPENIIHLTDSLTRLVKNFLIVHLLKKNLPHPYKLFFDGSSKSTDPEVFKFYLEGMKFWNKSDLTQARESYLKALVIDSNFIPAMIYLSHTYGNQELYQEAKKWTLRLNEYKQKVTQMEKIMIETVNAHFFGTPSETIKYYKMLLDLDDQIAVAYYYLGRYYARLELFDDAIQEYEKNLELLNKWGIKPERAFDYTELGFSYHKTRQFRKEKKLYKQAEKDFPNDLHIIRRQAILTLVRGKTKQANEYIDKYISIQRGQGASEAVIKSNLASIYKEAEIFDVAEKYYREALSLEPENPIRQNNLANLLIYSGRDVDQGMALVEKALELRPDYFIYLYTKGLGLYKQGKYREALEIQKKSWDLRRELAVYNHEAFLHLEEAKKAVAKL